MVECMFDGQQLKDYLKALSEVVDECEFTLSSTGLFVRGMRKDGTVYASLETGNYGDGLMFGLYPEEIVKFIKGKEVVTLEVTSGLLTMWQGARKAKVPIIDCNNWNLPKKAPNLAPNTSFEIDSATLRDAIASCESVEKNCACELTYGNGQLKVSANMDARSYGEQIGSLMGSGEAKGLYSVEILKQALGKKGAVKVEYGTSYPMRLTWSGDAWKYAVVVAQRTRN